MPCKSPPSRELPLLVGRLGRRISLSPYKNTLKNLLAAMWLASQNYAKKRSESSNITCTDITSFVWTQFCCRKAEKFSRQMKIKDKCD